MSVALATSVAEVLVTFGSAGVGVGTGEVPEDPCEGVGAVLAGTVVTTVLGAAEVGVTNASGK